MKHHGITLLRLTAIIREGKCAKGNTPPTSSVRYRGEAVRGGAMPIVIEAIIANIIISRSNAQA